MIRIRSIRRFAEFLSVSCPSENAIHRIQRVCEGLRIGWKQVSVDVHRHRDRGVSEVALVGFRGRLDSSVAADRFVGCHPNQESEDLSALADIGVHQELVPVGRQVCGQPAMRDGGAIRCYPAPQHRRRSQCSASFNAHRADHPKSFTTNSVIRLS